MAGAKIVVIYPRPLDEAAFEKEYRSVHVPMMEEKMKGMSRLVLTKVLNSPLGNVAAYRFAEVHFPSMAALEQCTGSDGGKQVVAHSNQISTGGAPILLICEEESFVYW